MIGGDTMKLFLIRLLAFFNLTPADVISLLRGAIIAALGAAGTYFLQWVFNTNFGPYTPMIVAIVSAIVNAGRKSIDGPIYKSTGIQL